MPIIGVVAWVVAVVAVVGFVGVRSVPVQPLQHRTPSHNKTTAPQPHANSLASGYLVALFASRSATPLCKLHNPFTDK